jgi:hypothetical protein
MYPNLANIPDIVSFFVFPQNSRNVVWKNRCTLLTEKLKKTAEGKFESGMKNPMQSF